MIRCLGKSTLILFVLLLNFGGVFANSSVGASNNQKSSYWGIKLGFISAKTQYTGSWPGMINDYIKYRNQYAIGGFYGYEIAHSVYMQMELLYSAKGALFQMPSIDIQGIPIVVREKLTLKYLELPVLCNVVMNTRYVRPAIFGGIYVAYLLQSTQGSGPRSNYLEVNSKRYYKSFDYGPVLGMAGFVPIYEGYLILEVRFSYSFGSIINKNLWIEGAEYKNRAFSIMAGITL